MGSRYKGLKQDINNEINNLEENFDLTEGN